MWGNDKMNNNVILHEDMWGPHHIMVTAAHRYCLGRRTYIVSTCVKWLLKNWEKIEPHTRKMIREETQECIDQQLAGDACDIEEWIKLLELTK